MVRLSSGIILTTIVAALSAFILFIIGYVWLENGNAILLEDKFLNLQLLTSVIAQTFSLGYFSRWNRPSNKVIGIHLLIFITILPYFWLHYTSIRNEQRQVLLTFQKFRQARLDRDDQSAFELMAPDWQQKYTLDDITRETAGFVSLGPEYSIYSVHIYEDGQAEIVPNPSTSWWFRPSSGNSWRFEKVGTEWYVAPQTINYYMHFYLNNFGRVELIAQIQ